METGGQGEEATAKVFCFSFSSWEIVWNETSWKHIQLLFREKLKKKLLQKHFTLIGKLTISREKHVSFNIFNIS